MEAKKKTNNYNHTLLAVIELALYHDKHTNNSNY